MSENNNSLYVKLKYKDIESEFRGNYEDIWKLINEFLLEIGKQIQDSMPLMTVKGKKIPEIILLLRDQGYFNIPKTSTEIIEKLAELGKTNITDNAILMALKDLTERGMVKRRKEGKAFVYTSPWT